MSEEKLTAAHIEAMREEEALRIRLTRLLRRGQLKFEDRVTQEKHCDCCNTRPREYQVESTGEWETTPVSVITIRDVTMCWNCFVSKWVLLGDRKSVVGSTHPGTPLSQREYDGSRFYSGEG